MVGKSKRSAWFVLLGALMVALSACGQLQPQATALEAADGPVVVPAELPAMDGAGDLAALCTEFQPEGAEAPWFGAAVVVTAAGEYELFGVKLTVSGDAGYQTLAWNAEEAHVRVKAVLVKGVTELLHVYEYPVARSADKNLIPPEAKDVSAIVVCGTYTLDVKKSAATSYARDWEWAVVKSADAEQVDLEEGGSAAVGYTVDVTATPTLADFRVFGTIEVANRTPIDMLVTEVVDTLNLGEAGSLAIAVTCSATRGASGALGELVTVPVMGDFDSYYPLTPGAGLHCDYDAALLGAFDGDNKAKVGFKFLHEEEYVWDARFDHAPVTFGEPSGDVDRCVDLSDTLAGTLAEELCATAEADSWQFQYALTVGTHDAADVVVTCGEDEVVNVVEVRAGETVLASAAATVAVTTACGADDGSCALSQGYWRTHSKYGPARYDDTWASVGEDTPFFASGYTYYQIFGLQPVDGNAFVQLAYQYVAAVLNGHAGAHQPAAVQDALAEAEAYFAGGATPADVQDGAERARLLAVKDVLDAYNNGEGGVPHCGDAT